MRWFWEAVCVFAGELGVLDLASHTIAYNVIPLAFMLPLGLSIASTTRISTLLAEGKIDTARRVGKIVNATGWIAGTGMALFCLYFQGPIIALFAKNDIAVLENTKKIWVNVVIFLVLDCVMGTLSGVIRGLAGHLQLSLVMFACLWIFGLPLMHTLTFRFKHGLLGVWQTMDIVYVVLDAGLTALCFWWIDWKKVASRST